MLVTQACFTQIFSRFFSQVFPCSLLTGISMFPSFLTGISMFPSHRYFHVPFSGIFTFPFRRYFHVVPFSQVISCSLLIVSFWRSLLIKGMASHDYSNATFGVVLRVIPETYSIEINDVDYVVGLI